MVNLRIAKLLSASGTTLCAMCMFGEAALADGFGGSLAVTTDYVFRGVSQSRGGAALQGNAEYVLPAGWVTGVWGSTTRLDPRSGTRAEFDAYLSHRWNIGGDWNAKLTALHYFYPFDARELHYDYSELAAAMSYRNRAFLTVAWSFDASRYSTSGYADGNAISYDFAWITPLPHALTANVGVGYYDLSDLFDRGYWYWNAGIGYDIGDWHAEASYIGTDHTASRLFRRENVGNRWVATLLRRF